MQSAPAVIVAELCVAELWNLTTSQALPVAYGVDRLVRAFRATGVYIVPQSSHRHDNSQPSCDPAMSRGEFLQLLVNKALLAGTLVAVPMLVDAFPAPAQQQLLSGKTPG